MKTFTGRVAVVTGAAGGIGRATSQALADAGCHLALVDRDEAGLLRGPQPEASLLPLTGIPDGTIAQECIVES